MGVLGTKPKYLTESLSGEPRFKEDDAAIAARPVTNNGQETQLLTIGSNLTLLAYRMKPSSVELSSWIFGMSLTLLCRD